MADFSSITIIYNPKSTGNSERNARRLQKKLLRTRYRDKVSVVPTEYAGHAEKIASKMVKSDAYPLIISSSGDGGYNEVINGVLKSGKSGHSAVTGLLPSGNANDHYKQLHRPYVVRQILGGRLQTIDTLKISAKIDGKKWVRYAHSYIGFGISSEVGKVLNSVDLNIKNEVVIFMKTLLKIKPFTVIIDKNQQEFHSIILSNVKKMSKVLSLSKTAKLDDGKFEVFTSDNNKSKMIGEIVRSVTIGGIHEDRTNEYIFKTTSPLLVQLDGEVHTLDANCTVKIESCHKALRCII